MGIVSPGIYFWNLFLQKHALQRMMERGISRSEVKRAILNGQIIEEYLEDHPFPSVLIAHVKHVFPLHVVVAYNDKSESIYMITAYIPDEKHFEKDLVTRIIDGKK